MIRYLFTAALLVVLLNSCMTSRAVLLSSKPRDLKECFHALDSIIGPAKVAQFKSQSEREFITKGSFGLDKWIPNNWWLWHEGELSKSFQGLGVYEPADMTEIILTSYHRHLTNTPVELEQQVDRIKRYRHEFDLQKLLNSDSIVIAR